MFFAEHTWQTNSICLPHALEGIGEQAGTRDRPRETSEKRERGRMGTSVELLFPSLPSSLLSLNPRNRFNRFAQVENSSVQKFVRTRLNGVEETRAVSRAAFTRVCFFPYCSLPTFSSSNCFFSRASLASRFHAGSFGGSLGREGGCLIVSYKKYSRLQLPQKSRG